MTILRADNVLIIAFVLACLIPRPAQAGMIGRPCDDPSLFPNAAVNVVILPYEHPDSSRIPNSPKSIGSQLALLLQMNLLFEILDYGSVGVIQLVPTELMQWCNPADVWDRLSHQTAGGIVMVWGKIFEDRGQLFIQSYERFAIGHSREQFGFNIGTGRYAGQLSTQQAAFPVRKVTVDDLKQIAQSYQMFRDMRAAPSDNAAIVRLPTNLEPCLGCNTPPGFSYSVEEVRGQWARVRTDKTNTVGWLKLGGEFEGGPLSRFLPEVFIMKETAGYLVTRQGAAAVDPRALEKLVDRYNEVAGRTPSDGETLGWQLAGAQWLLSGKYPARCTSARSVLGHSLRIDSSDPDVRNLLAISELCASFNEAIPLFESDVADNFLSAIVLDRRRGPALDNLRTFYRQLQVLHEPNNAPGFALKNIIPAQQLQSKAQQLNAIH